MSKEDFNNKLDESYQICINELCNIPNWEEEIENTKFTLDEKTGLPKKTHIFHINNYYPNDNIIIQNAKHSYVFKRSHFYNTFNKPKKRIKRELIECWRSRGYFVKLFQSDEPNNKNWFLSINWK